MHYANGVVPTMKIYLVDVSEGKWPDTHQSSVFLVHARNTEIAYRKVKREIEDYIDDDWYYSMTCLGESTHKRHSIDEILIYGEVDIDKAKVIKEAYTVNPKAMQYFYDQVRREA